MFEAKGYEATTLHEVAAAAGVTKGALYHHFANKRQLFKAVVEDIQQELADHVARTAEKHEDRWEAFVAGWLSFLEITPRPGIRRVLMLEGPAVLGYREWQEIDDRYFLGPVTRALESLMRHDVIPEQPVDPLARTLLTISNALGTLIVESEDPRATRAEVIPVWAQLLGAVRSGR